MHVRTTRASLAAITGTVVAILLLVGAQSPAASATTTEIVLDGYRPSAIAVDHAANRAFTLNPSSGRITVSDLTTDVALGTLPASVDSTYDEAMLAVDPALGAVYIVGAARTWTGGKRYTLEISNGLLGGIAGGWSGSTIDLGLNVRPTAVAVDYFTHAVFVATTYQSGPFQINRLKKFTVHNTSWDVDGGDFLRLPNNVTVDSIAIDPALARVYLSNTALGSVSVIDEVTAAKWADVPVGASPRGIAVNPFTHELFVANAGSNTLSVIDGYTRSVAGATISVPGSPQDLEIDHFRGTVFIRMGSGPGSGPGDVAVLDGSARTVIAPRLPIDSARAIAIDAVSHSLYAALENRSAVAVVTE